MGGTRTVPPANATVVKKNRVLENLYRIPDEEDCVRPLFDLSEFQRRKLSFYFSLIDMDDNYMITSDDIMSFTQKMLKFAGTSEESELYDLTYDINNEFFESLCHKCGKSDVSISDWLDTWATIMKGCAAIRDFPYWVQVHVKLYFQIMDKDRDGQLTKSELRDYYTGFVGMDEKVADEQVRKGYKAMTADGDHPLNMENFLMNFANFIIGKDIYGPGEYVFGTFDIDRAPEPFKIWYPVEALDFSDDETVTATGRKKSRFTLKAAANTVIMVERMTSGRYQASLNVEHKHSSTQIPQVPRRRKPVLRN